MEETTGEVRSSSPLETGTTIMVYPESLNSSYSSTEDNSTNGGRRRRRLSPIFPKVIEPQDSDSDSDYEDCTTGDEDDGPPEPEDHPHLVPDKNFEAKILELKDLKKGLRKFIRRSNRQLVTEIQEPLEEFTENAYYRFKDRYLQYYIVCKGSIQTAKEDMEADLAGGIDPNWKPKPRDSSSENSHSDEDLSDSTDADEAESDPDETLNAKQGTSREQSKSSKLAGKSKKIPVNRATAKHTISKRNLSSSEAEGEVYLPVQEKKGRKPKVRAQPSKKPIEKPVSVATRKSRSAPKKGKK